MYIITQYNIDRIKDENKRKIIEKIISILDNKELDDRILFLNNYLDNIKLEKIDAN